MPARIPYPPADTASGTRDGARLEYFYVQPVCSPTRAELLTGRYHPRGGVRVPGFIQWPAKIDPGTRIRKIAGAIDLFPTLVDLRYVKLTLIDDE